ncbi:hypothetical protein B0H10DRAFT_1935067, partial [Mycena sp. CBHHK59/15]
MRRSRRRARRSTSAASPIPPDAFGVDAHRSRGSSIRPSASSSKRLAEQQQQPHQFAVQLEGGQPFGGWGLFDEDGRAVCAAGDGCRCPPGLCECGPPGEDAALGGGDARLVVSGERASCAFPGGASAPFFGLSPTGDAGAMGAFLTVPGASGNARSRSSSTSSELSAGRIAGLSLGEDAVEVPGPHNANPHSTSNPAAASNIIPTSRSASRCTPTRTRTRSGSHWATTCSSTSQPVNAAPAMPSHSPITYIIFFWAPDTPIHIQYSHL